VSQFFVPALLAELWLSQLFSSSYSQLFLSRLIFVQAASLTRYPAMVEGIGYLLIAVAVGLMLLRPSKHRHFARWSAKKFQAVFRPAGVVTALFGIFQVFLALK